jgi:uncharacterized protein (DUF2249 family)
LESQKNVVELDVRPILKAKGDPFNEIMSAVKKLKQADVFVLHATFKPLPLLTVMKKKGYQNEAKQIEKGHWTVHFWKESKDE